MWSWHSVSLPTLVSTDTQSCALGVTSEVKTVSEKAQSSREWCPHRHYHWLLGGGCLKVVWDNDDLSKYVPCCSNTLQMNNEHSFFPLMTQRRCLSVVETAWLWTPYMAFKACHSHSQMGAIPKHSWNDGRAKLLCEETRCRDHQSNIFKPQVVLEESLFKGNHLVYWNATQ